MRKSLVEVAGYDPLDPVVVGAKEDFGGLLAYVDTLVALREAARLTQSEVAQRMGTTQSAVSDLERAGSNPRIDTLQRYARAVGHPLCFRNPTVQKQSGRDIRVRVPASAITATDWKAWSPRWSREGKTQIRVLPAVS